MLRHLNLALSFLLLFGVGNATAQAPASPEIFAGGVVNAASFSPSQATGGALAQGSLFSIFGSGLGPDPGVSAREFPLQISLAGVSVEVESEGGEVVQALPVYVGSGQINALLPSGTPVGDNFVRVTRDGRASPPQRVKVVRASAGIFTRDLGSVSGAAVTLVTGSRERPASLEEPARPGDTAVLWVTGLGPIDGPDSSAPPVGDLETSVEVMIGGRAAAIEYAGRSPCCAGLDQINIRIPLDAPLGCFVPLSIRLYGSISSNIAAIPISDRDGPCWLSDAQVPAPNPLGARGLITLERTEYDEPGQPEISDTARAYFQPSAGSGRLDGKQTRLASPARAVLTPALPAAGNCLAPAVTIRQQGGAGLDAGAGITLSGPSRQVFVPRGPDGYWLAAPPESPFLGPGLYHADSAGGPEFPPFVASLQATGPPQWTNRESLEEFPRLNGLTFTWTPQDAGGNAIVISGYAPNDPAADPLFLCNVSAASGSFTVDPFVLAQVESSSARVRFGSTSGPALFEFVTDGPETGWLLYRQEVDVQVSLLEPLLASTPVRLPAGELVQAELATSASERSRGLMRRPHLDPKQGMLFMFESPGLHSFWMFNTLIPLDIIWLDSDRRIVFVSADTPPCPAGQSTACPTYGGLQSAQFVLELAAGQAAANGLAIGDRLDW